MPSSEVPTVQLSWTREDATSFISGAHAAGHLLDWDLLRCVDSQPPSEFTASLSVQATSLLRNCNAAVWTSTNPGLMLTMEGGRGGHTWETSREFLGLPCGLHTDWRTAHVPAPVKSWVSGTAVGGDFSQRGGTGLPWAATSVTWVARVTVGGGGFGQPGYHGPSQRRSRQPQSGVPRPGRSSTEGRPLKVAGRACRGSTLLRRAPQEEPVKALLRSSSSFREAPPGRWDL